MKKIYITLLLCLFVSTNVLASDHIFYLSREGFLIEFDLEDIIEKEQIPAGSIPFATATCGGHIYYTDFGRDTVYDYNPITKESKKVKFTAAHPSEKAIYKEVSDEPPKSAMRVAFESVFRTRISHGKKEKDLSETVEPLDVQSHNKKLGLSNIACDNHNLYVVSTLDKSIRVVDRQTLNPKATLSVGERPSGIAVNPSKTKLAVSSTALDKVFLINISPNVFKQAGEIDVEDGPTELSWVNDSLLAVLNRGVNKISFINASSKSVIHKSVFDELVNDFEVNPATKSIYVLSGNAKKIYVVRSSDYKQKSFTIDDGMRFPSSLMFSRSDQLIVNSEIDSKVLLVDLRNRTNNQRIRTNFTPKEFIKLDY